jgi:hypothetical protein
MSAMSAITAMSAILLNSVQLGFNLVESGLNLD